MGYRHCAAYRSHTRLKETEMSSKILIVSFVLASAFAPACFGAQDSGHDGGDQQIAANTFPGHGTVNSVDAAGAKVNLSHDAIKALRWPKMTMDFTVRDPALLKGIKPGMEVDFELTKMGGGYQITKITPAPR